MQYDPTYGYFWKYGIYVATHGSYTVAEGYVETLIPLLQGLNFNGTARYTDYSTSGGTDSWKLGLTWSPISDITFRATRSASIRAGSLAELFSPGAARTNSVTNDFNNNNSLLFVQKLEGSPNVQPETAKTDVLGVVFQPRVVPGLQGIGGLLQHQDGRPDQRPDRTAGGSTPVTSTTSRNTVTTCC